MQIRWCVLFFFPDACQKCEFVERPNHAPVAGLRDFAIAHVLHLGVDLRGVPSMRLQHGCQCFRKANRQGCDRRERHENRQEHAFVDAKHHLRAPEQHGGVPTSQCGRRRTQRVGGRLATQAIE